MNIYLQLLLVTAIVVYIEGLSGWTETWLGWLSRFTQRHGAGPVRSLRPFSCSACMTWWCCLLWAFLQGELTLPVVAASAGFAFLSITFEKVLIFLREWTLWLLDKIGPIWK